MALKKTTPITPLHPAEARSFARDFEGLSAQLADGDAAVRRWAARDLANHPGAAAVICASLRLETEPAVRSALFNTAARLGGATVVESLLPLLRSDDAGLRNGAIDVLAGLPAAVAPHLEALLRDADSDVRILAIDLLAALAHPKVCDWLSERLRQDTVVNVVGAALALLAEVGSANSLPAIHAAALRFPDDAYIAFAAGIAIAQIGKP